MTPATHDSVELALLASITADIARTLESPADSEDRIRNVLRLSRRLIPYDRCALRLVDHRGRCTIVVPEIAESARADLERALDRLLTLMATGDQDRPRSIRRATRLALPIIGDDHVVGVLLVEHDGAREYEPHHIRLMSSIASQLGSYLALARLHRSAITHTQLLEERERELQTVARFREEFIGIVGHDLRTPLSAIVAGAHVLSLDPQAAHDMTTTGRILSSANRMARMIDDLLDFTRGRIGGGIPIQRRLVSTREVCQRVIDELGASHPGRVITLASTGDDRAELDPDRIAQMVSNLVANALRYSPPESVVGVEIAGSAHDVTLRITNAGTPITSSDLAGIFEPFRRGRAQASNTGEGLGLGLYIVERIARAHDGAVSVSSSAEDGTGFTVRLPKVGNLSRSSVD